MHQNRKTGGSPHREQGKRQEAQEITTLKETLGEKYKFLSFSMFLSRSLFTNNYTFRRSDIGPGLL